MGKGIAFVIVFGLLAAMVSMLAAAVDWPASRASIAAGVVLLLGVLAFASLKTGEGPSPLRHVENAKKRVDRMAPFTLSEYRNLIAKLPAPSAEQQQNFARFVAEAHRWYAYLPLHPPGAKFHFFIDPVAGWDRAVSWGGTLGMVPRESGGAYPSSLPTKEYRERFGYLAFSCAETNEVGINAKGALVLGDDLAAVPDDKGLLRRLPPEVQRAGAVRLTAAIHPECAGYSWWDQLAELDLDQFDWPEEPSRKEALQRLIARYQELSVAAKDPSRAGLDEAEIRTELLSHLFDPALKDLLNHARQHQQREMVAAMQRVCKLVYG